MGESKAIDENDSLYGGQNGSSLWEEKAAVLWDRTVRDSDRWSKPVVPKIMHSLGSEDVFRNSQRRVQGRYWLLGPHQEALGIPRGNDDGTIVTVTSWNLQSIKYR